MHDNYLPQAEQNLPVEDYLPKERVMDETKEWLKYISNSPKKENGGFNDKTIEGAKKAIIFIQKLEAENARLREYIEKRGHEKYCLKHIRGLAGQCTCGYDDYFSNK